MAKSTFQILAIVAVVALAGTATVTVMATGRASEGHEDGLIHRLHALGQRLHGGDHHHDPMARLIEQLELTPGQQRRLEKIHEIMQAHGEGGSGSMAELHERLVSQVEQGRVETDEIRLMIDGHVERIREMAYAVTDELIGLVNELDATQRETLLNHLQGHHEGHHAHGH